MHETFLFHTSDQHRIAYIEYGAPEGTPLIYFHGFPGSRFEAAFLDEAAKSAGIRVIAFDRPGYGGTGKRRGRVMETLAADLCSLLDHLAVKKVALIGVSGGGPFALAVGAQAYDRISSVTLVGGVGPMADPGSAEGMPLNRQQLHRWLLRFPVFIPLAAALLVRVFPRDPETLVQAISRIVSDADRDVLGEPVIAQTLHRSISEGLSQSSAGIAADARAYLSRWPFALRSMQVPVNLWHGDTDYIVPHRMSEDLASRIPNSRLQVMPGEGHYSLPFRHYPRILQSITHP